MKTSGTGIALITKFEGFPNGGRPYDDPIGFATVGYGHLIARRRVVATDRAARWLAGQKTPGRLTQGEAERLLRNDLDKREAAVERCVDVPLTQGQFDALVSFVFNVGIAAFAGSTVVRRLNQRDYTGAADALLMWDKAGSPPRVVEGLTNRRKAERAVFLRARAPLTDTEQRWISEYDRLLADRRDPHRRDALRRAMTLQRKRIWRRAQPATHGGDGHGWEHQNRRGRYHELLRRTR